MNDRQRNKLNMYVLLKDYLAANGSITSRWSKFAALFASFVAYIAEILTVTGDQEVDHTGDTEVKNTLRGRLVELLYVVSEKCMGYATVEEDEAFAKLAKLTMRELDHLSDSQLLARAIRFIADVTPKVALVEEYDLTPSEVEDLTTAKDAFEAFFTTPTGETKETKGHTQRLDVLFELADAVLVKITAMVKSARTTKPEFYGMYMLKHEIVDLGGRMRALQLLVIDFVTGDPVPNAEVMTKQKGGTEMTKSVKYSGTSGMVYENNKEIGEYEFTVKKGGCIDESGSFFINHGEMTEVVVRLKKS
jgi:hypothetical protein